MIIVTDLKGVIRKQEKALFYVATSRAQDRLILIASRKVEQELEQIIMGDFS